MATPDYHALHAFQNTDQEGKCPATRHAQNTCSWHALAAVHGTPMTAYAGVHTRDPQHLPWLAS
eukprot:1118118-Prymnesium_polylepis.1